MPSDSGPPIDSTRTGSPQHTIIRSPVLTPGSSISEPARPSKQIGILPGKRGVTESLYRLLWEAQERCVGAALSQTPRMARWA